MEPISIMILAAIITKMVGTYREDMEYARHGKESPRYKMKLARYQAALRAGEAGVRPPATPGAEGFVRDLWDDCWEDLGEYRRRKRQAGKDAAGRQRDQQTEEKQESLREWSKRSLNTGRDGRPVDDMIDVIREDPSDPNNTRNCPDCKGEVVIDGRPCLRCLARQQERNAEYEAAHERREAEWKEGMRPVGNYERPTCARCRETYAQPGSVNCPACDRAEGNYPDEGEPTADDVLNALAGPGGLYANGINPPKCSWHQAPMRQVDGKLMCPSCIHAVPPQPEATEKTGEQVPPEPHQHDPAPDNVIPLFPNAKETDMSNAEITGLPTAINFAQGMAAAHRAASTAGGEQYVAALRKFEVGDGTIATVATAQELSAQAAAAWEKVATEMSKQTVVTEAYQAAPDAGNKQFVTGE